MTTKKLLSIVLLTSLAANALAGTKSKKHKPKHCKEKKECCTETAFDRKFHVCLSFAQELAPVILENEVPNRFQPRPASQAPKGFCHKGVSGSLELCFEKNLSAVHYKLCVCGVKDVRNLNELVTQAHLHAGRANQNGPVIAFLFNVAELPCGPGVEFDRCVEGTLCNEDIRPVTSPNGYSFNSVASLLDGIRRGEVYVNVHGSDFENCKQIEPANEDEKLPSYADGLIRGQVFAEETTG